MNSTLQVPFLDRLLDDAPELTRDPSGTWSWDSTRARAALARDLEMLLNTRRLQTHHLEGFPEAARSVLSYGMDDLGAYTLQDPSSRTRLLESLTEVLQRHEPRLKDVQVHLVSGDASPNHLAFRIEGRMAWGPAVAFDARFHLGSQRCRIQQA